MTKFDSCLIIEITENPECVLLMYVTNSEINLSYQFYMHAFLIVNTGTNFKIYENLSN